MINRLNTLFLLLFVSLMAFGQSAGTIASKDAMLYESSRHLYEKGDTLTIISRILNGQKAWMALSYQNYSIILQTFSLTSLLKVMILVGSSLSLC